MYFSRFVMMFASNSSFYHLLLYLCITDIRIQLKTAETKYITEILHQRQLNPANPIATAVKFVLVL